MAIEIDCRSYTHLATADYILELANSPALQFYKHSTQIERKNNFFFPELFKE